MIRIVLVDNHAVVREGVRFLLEQQSDMEVIGEGKDSAQGVALVTSLLPDVVLLDLLMPRMDSITAVHEMKRLTPSTQIIMLTSYYEVEQIFGAIKAGALSYLIKDVSPEKLVEAVRAAAGGEGVLPAGGCAGLARNAAALAASGTDDPRDGDLNPYRAGSLQCRDRGGVGN